jgi:four helix bundle protein
MNSSRRAQSFRDLIVCQKAREVSRSIFELSRSFPKEETYSLTDQGRRSSRSIGAQISEAWGKRRYERQAASFCRPGQNAIREEPAKYFAEHD